MTPAPASIAIPANNRTSSFESPKPRGDPRGSCFAGVGDDDEAAILQQRSTMKLLSLCLAATIVACAGRHDGGLTAPQTGSAQNAAFTVTAAVDALRAAGLEVT